MTTTIDPYGSPYTVFNRDGSSMQEFVIPGGILTNLQTPSSISHVVVDVPTAGPYPNPGEGLLLPSSAEVGDVVYVYVVGFWPLNVIAPTGENISGSAEIIVQSTNGAMFTKYSNTAWAVLAR